jgi:hypothetical protein
MVSIDKFLELLKKHGATGVLALWLFYTHTEVQDLKLRLYDCYGKGKAADVTNELNEVSSLAIIPKDELNDKVKTL